MKHITSGRIASALIAATLLTSPMAMASDHGEHHRGKHDKAEMCENMREGKGWFNDEKRQAKWAEHRNDMADRLKLTDEQREIWDKIHEERREKHSAKMEKRQKKMEKRCKDTENRTSEQ
ncbi:hypothetical protein Q9252_06900 [Marinobacter salarius]|uniref:hypothetical protein n=1 Tax=Marinobacter salarius TaxID=1420917 RepID=UPI00273BE455|nr:hypothetical protein [Marinobacter salarius]MDP4531868.1 hypothetical protein [Marinobacter salarius]